MGDIVSTLFGGSKSKSSSTSSNQAYPFLQNALGGSVGTGTSAMGALGDFLGLGGADGTASAGAGLQNYMNTTGFQNLLDTSTKAITGSAAAKGLFQSGATGKAINANAQNLAEQSAQNYLGNLSSLAGLGINAANTIGGAGQQSSSTSSGNSSSGIFKQIPLFSDRRLKRGIFRIGTVPVSGSLGFGDVGIYRYRYVWSPLYTVGVMADEVASIKPEALGPTIFGFNTVRYDRLFAEA